MEVETCWLSLDNQQKLLLCFAADYNEIIKERKECKLERWERI